MQVLRADDAMPAVLLWQTTATVRIHPTSDPVDPLAQQLRTCGFRGATDALADLVAPLARKCTVTCRGDALELIGPRGLRHAFAGISESAPSGWMAAAADTKRILMVYGSGFGLERFSSRRVDEVLQAGEALCALVPYAKSA